ncbi:MAG: ankyrin repeat domain-containing protein (plasmid) [Rickettsia endosymbiont of Culicoides impunctatus]|nr:MAG: ankyrin repeat domain-containing protein [Rickettsia endosymbiont of Culicoides impunctatus]
MSDNHKLSKQVKPQEFELIELLFQEYISVHIASPNIEYSFQARFQSFINQIPSYLHSSSKTGFFTHFFFGAFASLLDTKLAEKIGIKKLHYNFDRADTLKVVAETDGKTHVFIFKENSSKNNKQQQQNKNKDLEFTKGEWKILKGKEYTDVDENNLEINIIKVDKSQGSIKVTVVEQDIKDVIDNTKQYHDMTKQYMNNDGEYITLEKEILKLSVYKKAQLKKAIESILKYTKKIHDHYQGLPYGDGAKEANEHGFVAGIFNNFRYRENAHVYLEQFASRGYADIILLVRGADRSTNSIPIIIELKAGSGISTTPSSALEQATKYSQGFQPNNKRILSFSDNILCIGMNLDNLANSFMATKFVSRQTKVIPVIQQIMNQLVVGDILNQNPAQGDLITIQQTIKKYLENTYNTFPGTGEKSSVHYFSRFLLGESLAIRDYDKHIFIYDKESQISTATMIDDHGTRGGKKQKIEKIVDGSNAVTSILLISKDQNNPAIILNIIDANREVEPKKLPLDSDTIGNRKIISLDIKFNIDKSSKEFQQYCNTEIRKIYDSILEYNNINSVRAVGSFTKIGFKYSSDLILSLKNSLDSQNGLIISESKYKELFKKIAEVLYPIKSLVNSEVEFQGILEGIFKYYSDAKLAEGLERRELILTEFQIGGGGRIDMLVQAIGASEQATKEYTPVGLELKYDNSIQLSLFELKQDESIQNIIWKQKVKKVVSKLLDEQVERYAQGAAIKSITDGNKVAMMGLVFNAQAQDSSQLLLTTDKFLEADIVHSSKLYSVSTGVIREINDLPKPDSEYFEPDWVHKETYDLLAKIQGEDNNLLSLFNKNLDDNDIKKLQSLLKDKPSLRFIDGLDVSYNKFTATALKGLVNMLNTKLIYLDLSDNDLAKDNFADFKEIIKNIDVPILKILDTGMNDTQMKSMIELLAEQDKVSHLETQHLELSEMSTLTADSVASYLRSTRQLEHLDLSRCGIADSQIIKIAQELHQQNTLQKLVLTENKIGKLGIKSLSKMLPSTRLYALDLSGNPLGIYGLSEIVKALPNSKVEVIKLVDVEVKYDREGSRESIDLLASTVRQLFKNTKLKHIDISYNDIGNGLLSQIFNILSETDNAYNLKELSLAGNRVDWGAHQATINTLKENIRQFLDNNKTIHALDLSYMEIDSELGCEIAQGLDNNCSLISLDLSGNTKMGSKTISELSLVLSRSIYLKYLNLFDNKLSIKDIKTLLSRLKSNQDLTHLNLADNDFSGIITDANGKKISDLDNLYVDFKSLLQGNNSLKYLNLAKCKLNYQSLESLFALLKKNSSLEILDIRENIIGNEIVDYIVGALRENASQGLDGLKVIHISKDTLDHTAITKLTDKSLGISVMIDDYIPQNINLSIEFGEIGIERTCAMKELGTKHLGHYNNSNSLQESFEHATSIKNYHYWLQQYDIPDIARIHYEYKEGEIEVVGSIDQLNKILSNYRQNCCNNPLTLILNIGENGQDGNHWVSMVLNRVNNEVHAYYADSLGTVISSNIVSLLINNHGILVHDISIMQQRDGYNCGLWALENGRMISRMLLNNNNENIDTIRSSLQTISYDNQQLQILRDIIANELSNSVSRIANLISLGILPQPFESYKQDFEASLDCMLLAAVYLSQQKHKRSIPEAKDKLLVNVNKEFLDCTDATNIEKYKVGFEFIKLIYWDNLTVDVESCNRFNEIINSFYAALYSRIHQVDTNVLCSKIQETFFSQDVSKLERVLNTIKGFNELEIICGETFIIYSVEKLNIEWTRLLIEKWANIDARDIKGNTALYYAIKKNDKEVTKLLIKYRADLNTHNYDGDSPIHLAVKNNNTEICKLLIDKGANVDAKDRKGNTPLIIATVVKNKELVNNFILHGADVNVQNNDGYTATSIILGGVAIVGVVGVGVASIGEGTLGALGGVGIPNMFGGVINGARGYHRIASSSDSEILESLVGHGADLNIMDSFGNTPLHNAVTNNDIEMVEFCIDNGSNIDVSNNLGETPLHIGINNLRYRGVRTTRDIKKDIIDSRDDNKTKEIISILVKHNASVSIQNNNGDTVLHLAFEKNDKEVIGLLLKSVEDGKILLLENSHGHTVLKLALMSSDNDIISCFINFRDYMGNSALHLAVKNNAKEIIDLLIKNNIDLNIVNNNGATAIHLAVASNNEELVEYLIGYHVKINIQDVCGNTPMHLSAEVGNIKIFEIILEDNADLNLKNQDGKTPMDLAMESGMNITQFALPTPIPMLYNNHYNKELTIKSKELENTYHHKHRHHHGENSHREVHHSKNNGDHHKERRDIENKFEKIARNNSNSNMLDLQDDTIISSTASSMTSSINNMINWLKTNVVGVLLSNVLNPVNKISWSTVENIKSSSIDAAQIDDSRTNNTAKNSSSIKSVDYAQFNLNDNLTLANVIIRKITKVKSYITKEESLNLLEVQGHLLNIITGFGEILEKYSQEKDILMEELEFDPIALQKQLISEIVNGNHSNIVKILYKSIESTQIATKATELKSHLQDKITTMLEKQQDILLANEPLINNRQNNQFNNQSKIENTDIVCNIADIENYVNITTNCQMDVSFVG